MITLWMALALAQDDVPAPDPEPEEPVVETETDDQDREEARTLFENATVLYEEGDYNASLSALDKAYSLFPNAALKFNMANCFERLGRYQEAIAAMNQYRAVAPAEERVTLERRIRAMEARAAEEAAKPEPVAVTPTRVVKRPNIPLIGLGAGLAVVGGVGAGVSSGMASGAFKRLDRSSYGTARALNATSFAVVGAGIGTAVLGLIVTKKKTIAVSVLPTPSGGAVAFGGSL